LPFIFQIGSHAFAWAGLRPQNPPTSASQVARIIGVYHHVWPAHCVYQGCYIF
jgi:hypothetical protein